MNLKQKNINRLGGLKPEIKPYGLTVNFTIEEANNILKYINIVAPRTQADISNFATKIALKYSDEKAKKIIEDVLFLVDKLKYFVSHE